MVLKALPEHICMETDAVYFPTALKTHFVGHAFNMCWCSQLSLPHI